MSGELLENVSLARFTSWRIGGVADRVYKPSSIEDLAQFIQSLPENEPLTWLGLGSNVLIRDGGIRGTVILLRSSLQNFAVEANNVVRAEAGVSCAKVARFAARNDLIDGEFLAGIPGTIGGALAMNAGAFGGETWEKVIAVETIDRQGQLHTRYPDEYQIAYREVKGPANEWFVAGHFQLTPGDGKQSLARIKTLLDKRAQTQPTGEHSCGSVFRNPPGNYAAHLIEQAGLKGYGVGGAEVSKKHANFIINQGEATAQDVETLISTIADKIQMQYGVQLIREAHILGEESKNAD